MPEYKYVEVLHARNYILIEHEIPLELDMKLNTTSHVQGRLITSIKKKSQLHGAAKNYNMKIGQIAFHHMET